MAYSKQVVERFESVLANPEKHAVGRFDPKDPMVATGLAGAPSCGDVMKLDLKLDDNDTILDVKFKKHTVSVFNDIFFALLSNQTFFSKIIYATMPK